ncbi:MAG: EscJ/YscJ/HrcJ family type III secretion inner membrane ring protein [Mesorhizobium sp.]|nr:EscJ/YscJ/HrcJ family type III secretion inner membrane ring protein [Mesorhizobium sp. M4B.F.Ca.ET.058.02.1.1]RVC46750.1 EscJ/YscJ/HrcJ family type III secretion inner membrane ring protein [Mesorhizobium sp. M4A.F.Ca.ET.090.04.2.1]RVD71680.1 EscJ/YscJ/HrcJ family type III secretion inner membrane ring protein [Mesorhizobium sp. M4A.F.Ca.ET.029.04.2.1]RWC57103.1 MAG: EscJ/YscJ/HrcJ family type III secretion inner membrane ring protein [Mesorhizobium sp.]RWD15950.1 MAG: EscJ/YscJ/HrcJ family
MNRCGAWCRVALVVTGMLVLQACSVELYSNLNQRQANEIVATLMRHGIPAQREAGKDGKMTVSVQKDRFAEAMVILDESGLPKQEFQTLGEVFKRDGLVSSPVEERATMIYGLSQELSQTISDIDGVLSARVHLVLPENDPLRQQLVPSSASVFIRHRASVPMNELIPQVKMLVAKGIAGLTYDNVSVTLIPVTATAPEQQTGEAGFTTFLGLWLHPDSVAAAMWLFYGMAAAILALAARLAYLQWYRRPGVYALDATALPVKKT